MSTTQTAPLTETEDKVYQYLIAFLAENSYQPSIREIGRQFEIKSTKTVSDVLGSLARKGMIQRNQSRSRGLRIIGAQTPAAPSTRSLPFYDRAADVGPALSPEYRTDWVLFDRRLAQGERAFCIRITESSAPECGVQSNDTVIVDPDAEITADAFVITRTGATTIVRSASAVGQHDVLGVVSGVFRATLERENLDREML